MITLYDAARCPYCARVRIALAEKGIEYETVEIDLDDRPAWIYEKNVTGRVPVLEEDAFVLPESDVICEYLDATFGNRRLLPGDGPARWRALTTMALADGVTAAGMLVRQENMKPAERRSSELIALQTGKVDRGLNRLQRDVANRSSDFDLPGIATACAIGWLAFRFGDAAILGSRDELRTWYQAVAARPSMQATVPVEPT